MKNFKTRKGNFLKNNDSTSKMMYTLLLVLVPFIIFATFKNGIYPAVKGYGNLYTIFKPLIYVLIPSIVCLITEYIYYLIKKDKKTIFQLFGESYAIIPGVFIGLITSINSPIYLLIISAIIASLSKLLCGGLGKNKLNPALFGSLFTTVLLSSLLGGYLNPYEVDTIASATPLSNQTASGYLITYQNLVAPYGSILSMFFGNIPGSIGETSSFLCIIALIYLIYKKVIKWRIPVSYLLSVITISIIMCLIKDIGPWFILFNLFTGGLLFGSIFMATDPVTSPITNHGQILGGIILGILTMTIRYLTPLPEGVLISILIYNIITIFINKLAITLYNKNNIKNIFLGVTIVLCLVSPFIISRNIITKEPDNTFKIISKERNGKSAVYQVSGRGYAGNNSIKLKVIIKEDQVVNIEVLSSHETYIKMIYDEDYLNKIINNQNNLEKLDTISGCTYTSKYLKEIIEKTKEDYQNSK